MSDSQQPAFSRRIFLQHGVAFVSMAATAPLFIQNSARGVINPWAALLSSQPGVPEDHVLVVVQLGGGNDGLNTVVPYGTDAYYKARPAICRSYPGSGRCGYYDFLSFERRAQDDPEWVATTDNR